MAARTRMAPVPMPIRLLSYIPSSSHGTDDGAQLAKALVDNGAVALQQLLEIQAQGWQDDFAEKHFQRQRQNADNASSELTQIWFKRMKIILREIDESLNCIAAYEPLKFLDLGCCPGGFSSYVLDKNRSATGYGISLPVAEGGHEFAIEDYNRLRISLFYQNLTYYQLGPSTLDDSRLQQFPPEIGKHAFNLILLDGHQLRTQSAALPWDRDRLLISQLVIALEAIVEGGTLIIKLPLPHKIMSAKILYLLKILSDELVGWKPKTMHANRGTFYAVAKGIGRGPEGSRIANITLALKELWFDLTFGGEEGSGRFLSQGDFDFLITLDELIAFHLHWLIQIGLAPWLVQEQALKKLLRKKRIF